MKNYDATNLKLRNERRLHDMAKFLSEVAKSYEDAEKNIERKDRKSVV